MNDVFGGTHYLFLLFSLDVGVHARGLHVAVQRIVENSTIESLPAS